MTKSQLIDRIAERVPRVPRREVEAIVNAVFACMVDALARQERIEIRGFGSFSVKVRPAREGRNPKTGVKVQVPPRRTLSFTVGKELRDRLNPDRLQPAARAEAPADLPAPRALGNGVASSAEPLAAAPAGGPRFTMG